MGRISSFLLGGAIGACVALAFAPKTGEETRALVAEKANAFAGEAMDFGAGLPGSAQDAFNSVREKGSSLVSDAQVKAKDVAGKASDTNPDELREKIEAARQRIAAQVMENAEKAKEADAGEVAAAAADKVEDAAAAAVDKADEAKHAK